MKIYVDGEEVEIVNRMQLEENLYLFLFAKVFNNLTPYPDRAEWLKALYSDFNSCPVMSQVAQKIKEWSIDTQGVCSILSHQNGIGKTRLAKIKYKQYIYEVAKHELDEFKLMDFDMMQDKLAKWVREMYNIRYIVEPDLYRTIRGTYDDKNTSETEIMDEFARYDLLVIDDIFRGKVTEFERSMLLELIDKRTENYLTSTIVTSNLLLPDIANIDTRIADRLRGQQLHQIKDHVESWRGRK